MCVFERSVAMHTRKTTKAKAPLLPVRRRQEILDLLREALTLRVGQLSERFGVSEMTIRRDLEVLEQRGLLERTHGGAVFRRQRVADKFRYRRAMDENPQEKQRIARRAAARIQPHDTLYVGEGTSCAQVIRHADPRQPFTVVTNNLGVIPEIAPKAAELILLGGTYNPATHALAGPLTLEMIARLNANRVFLGADGISRSAGLSTPNLEIGAVERSMIAHTRGEVIVMAAHSKLGMVATVSIAPIERIDVLITDSRMPDDFKKDLESMGIEVVLA